MIYVITIVAMLGWLQAIRIARRYRALATEARVELTRLERAVQYQLANAEYWKGQVSKLSNRFEE